MNTNRSKYVLCLGLYSILRSTYLNIRSVVTWPYGLVYFTISGKTPQIAYQSMVWLFCTTQGKFNDWVSWLITKMRPAVTLINRSGVLGDMSDGKRLANALQQLREDGFIIFPSALPADAVQRLCQFTNTTPALVRRMDGQDTELHISKGIYTGGKPVAVRYDYDPFDLLNLEDVQALLADGSLLSVAQKYLCCEPLADVISMWWHTNYHTQPDAEAAQFFHFDMDRFKWLKIFIYLTDVGPENGPHAFVRGSHQTGAIPDRILRRGYVRLTDEEVAEHYPAKDILSFSAPRGSIILEDTRGLHKGTRVSGDSRLILQLQFSNSLFGTNYPRARIGQVVAPELKAMLDSSPSIYRQYV